MSGPTKSSPGLLLPFRFARRVLSLCVVWWESIGEQGLKIASTVDDAQDMNLIFQELIEDQMHGKSCDGQPTRATQFTCFEFAECSGTRGSGNAQHSRSHRPLPALRQLLVRLRLIPVGLLQDIGHCQFAEGNSRRFHPRRARSRRTVTSPFLRISATGT